MKTRNATMQDRAYWDTILGTYENTLLRMSEKLKRDLRAAHYSGREELCRKLEASCCRSAEILHHYRHMLGAIPRA
ncbi:MAG: hypothetical protein IJG37_08715 [Synergistaceae bacterium]|nr:hypothetical protein [Synergistaceae bacterium]